MRESHQTENFPNSHHALTGSPKVWGAGEHISLLRPFFFFNLWLIHCGVKLGLLILLLPPLSSLSPACVSPVSHLSSCCSEEQSSTLQSYTCQEKL